MVLLVVAAMVLLTVLAVWLLQRDLRRNGHGSAGAIGDGLGNLIDVFDPGQSRASQDLKEQQNVGPVTPTPDPDPDDPVVIERGPDGMPARVRIRRP
ncbi:MAG: hypothetical protein J7518_01385 [Nocardioidaceae bacterium]|nr:hypothetical protein [Nocardioidaceae bacterium]